MKFSPQLQSATLIKRYKRFLADVTLPDGSELTMHCANVMDADDTMDTLTR